MATIGSFVKNQDGTFTGQVITLTLSFPARLEPIPATELIPSGPNYRIYSGSAELGGGWVKTAGGTGEEYISLTMDDPSFPQPISAALFHQTDGGSTLVWNRR
jgi:uncharacterized protein (DUF736 family)